jgi:hypothetical protein
MKHSRLGSPGARHGGPGAFLGGLTRIPGLIRQQGGRDDGPSNARSIRADNRISMTHD